jgi:hypothetical protein
VQATAMAMQFTQSHIGESNQEHVCLDAEDEQADYLAGCPYIVQPLSPSLSRLRIWYPVLSKSAENHFLREYIRLHVNYPPPPRDVDRDVWCEVLQLDHPEGLSQGNSFYDLAVDMIVEAQNLVKKYEIPRVYMSIRNLIRAVSLLSWLIRFQVATEKDKTTGELTSYRNIFLPRYRNAAYTLRSHSLSFDDHIKFAKYVMRNALIVAISTAYLFQLPSKGLVDGQRVKEDLRHRFLTELIAWSKNHSNTWFSSSNMPQLSVENWHFTIDQSLRYLWEFADIPRGIAQTNALMENFYCVLLSVLNHTPLLITGPPGTYLLCHVMLDNSILYPRPTLTRMY